MERYVADVDDLLVMLDGLFDESADRWTRNSSGWWDTFYSDRSRQVPFFRNAPDESLLEWDAKGMLPRGGRALDLGCGPGRNAVWLAANEFEVDAVDVSHEAVAWARDRADAAGVRLNLIRGSIFDVELSAAPYDLVYDSGCFHHLPPHRRISYFGRLRHALAPGGRFGLTCFAWGAMGSEATDADLYRIGGLQGGVAYRDSDLIRLFDWLRPIEVRRMHARSSDAPTFGAEFLWVALFERDASSPT